MVSSISNAWDSIKEYSARKWEEIGETLSGLWEGIKESFEKLPGTLLEIGRNCIIGLWQGFLGAKDWLLEQAGGLIQSVKNLFTFGFEIKSPSRWAERIGEYVTEGFGEGLESGEKTVEESAKGIVDALLGELELPAVVNSGSDMVDNIAEGVYNNDNLQKETVRMIRTTLNSANNEIHSGGFMRAGERIVEGMAQGARNASWILAETIRDIIGAALNAAKAAADIHSPSRLFRDEIGLQMALGIVEGVRSGTRAAVQSMENLGEQMFGVINWRLMRAMPEISANFERYTPIYARGHIVPAHVPYASIMSGSAGTTTNNNFHQTVTLADSETSAAEKIRLLQIQSRRMMRLGV
jgi:phage-related protein